MADNSESSKLIPEFEEFRQQRKGGLKLSYIPRNRSLKLKPTGGHTSLKPLMEDRNRPLLQRGDRAGWAFLLCSIAFWLAGFWWMAVRG